MAERADDPSVKEAQPTYEKDIGASPDGVDQYAVQEVVSSNALHRNLQGRHMQMIAIGGAIGAGLFVGSGASFQSGGPGSVLICFIIIGFMMYFVMQALAELTVTYPVNGAFFAYAVRFISPAWGFTTGWDYAVSWMTSLPFELTAAGLTLQYWKTSRDLNIGIWVAVFLVALIIIQIFGVRGYGEVEFFLSMLKILGCVVFIIVGIIIDCGGVPTDHRGYIGGKYWIHPGAFKNGFHGFCSVFVNASFAFGGTELVGLAAAEAANPVRSIPRATKQVLWRIAFFYVISLLIAGLIVSSDDPHLLHASNSNTKDSIFVLGLANANIPVLPSLMNGIITISVLSVANSCTFGSTRTLQALAARGMAPKVFAYVDKAGRPIACVLLQLCFGLLAFVQEAPGAADQFFTWLLALGGLANFFIWGTICLSHIRFRSGWAAQGHTLDELPYKASFGVIGSWIGFAINLLCIIATFYVAVFPIGGSPSAYGFFSEYLSAPVLLVLYLFWKFWTREWYFLVPVSQMDVTSGLRYNLAELREMGEDLGDKTTWTNWPRKLSRTLI